MALGRVTHKPRNRIGSREIRTVTYVGRDQAGYPGKGAHYQAYSCLARSKGGGNQNTWTSTCTRDSHARTPQSAIAKSLKRLAQQIAMRDNVRYRTGKVGARKKRR